MHISKPSRPEYRASVIFLLPVAKGNVLLGIITGSSNSRGRKVVETRSHSIAQVDLQLMAVFLPQLPDYWDYEYMPPQQAARCFQF